MINLFSRYHFEPQSGTKFRCGRKSKVGRGTTFTILLPDSTLPVRETAIDEIEATPGSETLLLLEDDPGVLETLAYGLRQEGYRVRGR